MSEAPGKHDPTVLPANIPVPEDDGATRHLTGIKLPDLALPATSGGPVNLSKFKGRTVVYIYPRTGVPGQALPTGWGGLPGGRRLPTHTSSQQEAATRLHLPFPILSDEKLAFTRALRLPTFSVDGMTLIKRMALVIDDGTITKVFYPVFPPDKNAEEVITWLQTAA